MGDSPEVGQKKKTEKKTEERAKIGNNNGQATHGARIAHASRLGQFLVGSCILKTSLFEINPKWLSALSCNNVAIKPSDEVIDEDVSENDTAEGRRCRKK